ncbi:TPA: transaldolase [Klebsiella quasipneumoniae subsp. quasipneumoniae]|uniref:transaldolase n=1 Tax=Klebsiella quasipneumoniae TaxID=1463165 RepID=UPI00298A538C|nr:transaldolase [Klebsiella quasipneumoniae subsp. quasipneumoniae]HBR1675117.1 transaldolase [Klebsiella quasipneumoniae subsp. quasipneumoniae]HBV4315532.1 transaldolase [Klebsiella quasipneumoniae]HCI6850629.1 transaldolase [Klebsiella quasipneumoniae subsp. quasipneumoniae]HDH1545539.1 transaldolase [Klebsiella quasipneumoniae subsp. quasipneumoniae]
MSQLDELKRLTTVVADSGDIEVVRCFKPQDATTNPSLILKAAAIPHYQNLIDDAIEFAIKQGGSQAIQIINASDKLAVNIGLELLRHVPGRVSTEVDARLSFDRGLCVAKARKLIRLYQQQGIDKSRILIKLAATWQGIRAAEELEKEGINCNLTLLFSFAQARACAEAGVYLISPFVGRIYDWYQQHQPQPTYQAESDPGVVSVRDIYHYYKAHGYPTVIMGASFRKTEQVLALAGCDRLTISPALLSKLDAQEGDVERKLCSDVAVENRPSPISEAEFYWHHHQDAMAVDKLAEGIRLFAQDQEKLEALLATRLAMQKGTADASA